MEMHKPDSEVAIPEQSKTINGNFYHPRPMFPKEGSVCDNGCCVYRSRIWIGEYQGLVREMDKARRGGCG